MVMMGRRMREGCVVMICRDFLRLRSRVEEMARIVCGRYKAENIMAISLLLQSYKVARLVVQYFTLILILSRPQQQGIRDKLL